MSLSATKFDHEDLKTRYNRLYNYHGYLKDKKAQDLEARMEEVNKQFFSKSLIFYRN